jgi:hypothetical protein
MQPLHDEALALGGNNIKVTYQGFSDNLHPRRSSGA